MIKGAAEPVDLLKNVLVCDVLDDSSADEIFKVYKATRAFLWALVLSKPDRGWTLNVEPPYPSSCEILQYSISTSSKGLQSTLGEVTWAIFLEVLDIVEARITSGLGESDAVRMGMIQRSEIFRKSANINCVSVR